MLALIAARGGSKRLPRKNILRLAGKPMVTHVIEAACTARHIDRVVVTTDDEEIARAARVAGADVPFIRPSELATDETPARQASLHALDCLAEIENIGRTTVALIQPTCPLLASSDIDAAIELFEASNASAVIAVAPVRDLLEGIFYLDQGGRLSNVLLRSYGVTPQIAPSQIYGPRYRVNGALVVVRVDLLLKDPDYFFSDPHVHAVILPEERAIDIDTSLDFKIAEMLFAEREVARTTKEE